MDRKLQKGIVTVFAANMINVIFSLLTNFLLPKYLSVESYAAIKTFQLYTSYVGFLHFGYIDGMYLKYGGKNLMESADEKFSLNFTTMKIFQVIIAGTIIMIAILSKDLIIILFAISILPQNLTNYFKYLYQATGEFSIYGKLMNISTILTFVVNMTMIFILRSDAYIIYLICYDLVYVCLWIILEIQFRKKYRLTNTTLFSFVELFQNIKDGFLLTLGNLASMFLTSMDRWFVKILLATVDFAQYSFAISVEGFLNLAITPITTTLYNFFCREQDEDKHRTVLRFIWVFATLLPAAAFPVKFILEMFLQNYISSSKVIFIVFAAQMFYIIIRSVFLNLYKMQKRQKTYFFKLVIVLCVGFIFNIVCFKIHRTKEAFAIGTLMSAVVWYFLSAVDFKYLSVSIKDYIYLFGELSVFLCCGFWMNSISGFFVYIIITLIMAFLFMHDIVENCILKLKSYI